MHCPPKRLSKQAFKALSSSQASYACQQGGSFTFNNYKTELADHSFAKTIK